MSRQLIQLAHKSSYDIDYGYKPPADSTTHNAIPETRPISLAPRSLHPFKPSKGIQLLDLPTEILHTIFSYIHPPWSALMSLSCKLTQLPYLSTLSVSRTLHSLALRSLRQNFTGIFIRWDRRGLITNSTSKPVFWYKWIMANTTVLVLEDAIFRGWYLHGYWHAYPSLRRFKVVMQQMRYYQDPMSQMPDFEGRRQRCEERTRRWAEGSYEFHGGMVFTEVACGIWPDVERRMSELGIGLGCCAVDEGKNEQWRGLWPEVEYLFDDCPCHPGTQTTVLIRFRQVILSERTWIVELNVQVRQSMKDREMLLHNAVARFEVMKKNGSSYLQLDSLTVQI